MSKTLKIFLIATIAIVAVGMAVFSHRFFGKKPVQGEITWGVDFSQAQTEYLKLDWKKTYSAMIDDLGVKAIKLHTNWDWVEGKKDDYYFKDIDWQIKQAEQRKVKILYVIGMKTGRWPECHIPQWAQNLPREQQQAALLQYIREVVLRYKTAKAIVNWQVENEPFLKFGQCPQWYYQNNVFLKEEVSLIKSLDPARQIVVSDSGELSTWFDAATIGDIVGITMYRKVLGFNVYGFLSPTTYSSKAEIIKRVFNKKVICIELQAEPWAGKPFLEAPLGEQFRSMNPEIFKENVAFAKKTGLDTFYFWGLEWWYWLKEKQSRPAMWNEARNLFQGDSMQSNTIVCQKGMLIYKRH